MTSELKTLSEQLTQLCGQYDLAFARSIQPVKVGPDCYYFYATRLHDECRRIGFCKEEKFYALTGGERIDIVDGNRQRLVNTREDA
jgi:hypothetical protein